LREQCGNLFENKGPAWKEWAESGNVYEDKGSYVFKAGMYMKTSQLMLSRCLRLRQVKTKSRLGIQANSYLISHAMPQALEKAAGGFGLAFLLPAVLGHNSDLDIVG
jgi:hypothetical protein